MGYWARVIETVSTIRKFVITRDGILELEFVIDGRLGKDSVMEQVSTIINFVVTGDGIL